MADAAAAETPSRTRPKSVRELVSAMLDELERAATPQPDPAPAARGDARADPRAKDRRVLGPTASLGDLIDRLDERGFGLLLFLLALPCVPPFVYGLPQIVALPMLALAGQMAAGRSAPWFPESIRRRSFSIPEFRRVFARMEGFIRALEGAARPRFAAVTSRRAAPILGALFLIPAASILLPLPATNTVPGIGIAIAALGLILADGALVGLGLLIGVMWPVMLVSLFLVFGPQGFEIAKDWILSRF